jgi:hypothetical protein
VLQCSLLGFTHRSHRKQCLYVLPSLTKQYRNFILVDIQWNVTLKLVTLDTAIKLLSKCFAIKKFVCQHFNIDENSFCTNVKI